MALGPKPRDYGYTLNKKVKRLALKSALSTKVIEENVIVLDAIKLDDYKTKAVAAMLSAIGAGKKALIVLDAADKTVIKSAANLPGVTTTQVNTLNVYDILNHDSLIMVKNAAEKIGEVYA